MKRLCTLAGATLLSLILFVPAAHSEQLSKIAVIDISRIIENFPTDSAAYRRYDQLRNDYEQEIARLNAQYDELRLELVALRENGTEMEISRKREQIESFLQNMRTYRDIMQSRIERAVQDLRAGSGIIEDILRAIEYIAQNEGYTAVFDRSDSNLIYYSLEIEITDRVIQRLRMMARYQ